MDFFLNRYRNITVLLIAIVGQLLLIAYQVKGNKDLPLIRVWAVTAVTPVEQALEVVRHYTWGFVEDYFVLLGVKSENDKLKHENGELKLENHYLKSELSTADRARSLVVFQAHSQSKTVAARIIGNGTGANSRVVFVDRGSTSAVESGMAVVTPDGIVGKVVDAYPTASLVMLVTDPTFAAGVISQKNHVRGTLKGQGHSECLVDYVQNEERVDNGEWFFTSGDDRIFPKGFPVGQVSASRNGKTFKEIYLNPSGMQGGLEEVLIVLEGVHQQIPDGEIASPGYKILQPPSETTAEAPAQTTSSPAVLATDADRLREQYKQAGAEQKHVFGEGLPGSKPPDFTKIPGVRAALPASSPSAGSPKPGAPSAVVPGAGATVGTNVAPTAKPAAPKAPAVAADADAPNPKPRPTAPILVTDPADADPDVATPQRPANAKPASTPGLPAVPPVQTAPKPPAGRGQATTNP
jgi:rod shape-determining protein MreC